MLLITIDTLRADALGSYGGRAATPNLDRLAARRRAVHVRARPRGADAAVARVDSHRPLSVRARHPRQQRLPRAFRRDDAGHAAEGARLRDRRVRQRVPARPALRTAAPASTSTTIASAKSARPRSSSMPERRADETVDVGARLDRPPERQVVRLGPRLRSARAVRAARRTGGAAIRPMRMPAKSRGPTSRSGRSSIAGSLSRASDARDRHGGSRRKPRRTWRDDARHLRVRVDAARAADRRGDRAGRRNAAASPSTRRRGTSTSCPRSSTPSARPQPADLPGASLVDVIARGDGAIALVLRVDDAGAGARLGAAARRHRRPREVHRPADSRALRPRCRSKGELQNVAAVRGRPRHRCSSVSSAGSTCAARTGRPRKPPARASGCARSAIRAAVRHQHATGTPRRRSQAADRPRPDAPSRARAVRRRASRPTPSPSIQQVIARRPDTADAYRNMAFVLWQAGRPRAGDRDARSGDQERRDAARHPGQARHLPRRRPAPRRKPSRCSKRSRRTTPRP